MEPGQIVEGLGQIENRGPGTDAERRAARWLQERLRDVGRDADAETVWVRPADAGTLFLHALAAVIGSVVSAFAPLVGLIVLGATLVSLVLDMLGRLHLVRRLTVRRATQNLVSGPPGAASRADDEVPPVLLIVTAGYDAGRTSVLRRDSVARLGARLRGLFRGHAPGALGLVVFAVVVCAACAAGRLATGNDASWIAIVQVVPTVALLVVLAATFDLSVSDRAPGAGDASATGVALALAAALDESPPEHLDVELVLAGAASASSAGFREFVRSRRRKVRPQDVVVLHVAPCGRGTPRWWVKDGPLAPLRFHPRLTALAAQVAAEEGHLGARPYSGRAASGGWAARSRGWPAIAVGCLEGDGYVPGLNQSTDTPSSLDPAAMEAALELCLGLVGGLDEDLGRSDARWKQEEAAAAR